MYSSPKTNPQVWGTPSPPELGSGGARSRRDGAGLNVRGKTERAFETRTGSRRGWGADVWAPAPFFGSGIAVREHPACLWVLRASRTHDPMDFLYTLSLRSPSLL